MMSTTVRHRSRLAYTLAAPLLLLSGPARADELSDILEAVRGATGIANMSKHPGGVMITGKAEFLGQEGAYSLLYDGSGAFVQEIIAPIGMATGYDGTTVWVRDLGGEVREEHLGDRNSVLLGAAVLTGDWLRRPSMLEMSVDKGHGDEGVHRLDFTYDQGRVTGHVEIDRATSLPRRWTIASGRATRTIDIPAWADFGGMKLPGRVVQASSEGMRVATSSDSIRPAPAFIRNPYEPVLVGAPDAHFDAKAPAAVEVKKAPTGHVLVKPVVNGRDVGWFIFDTGAGSSVLNNATAAGLELKQLGSIPASGVGGHTMAGVYRATTLTLGPLTIDTPFFIGLDLSFLDQHMGEKIAGVIGYGLLARSVAEIDMTAGTVSLYDPTTFALTGAQWSKLIVYERVPAVEASFEGHTGFFKLDTGAGNSTVTIHAPTVERLKLLEGRQTTPTVLGGVGGQVPAAAGTLEWFEIGGHRSEQVKAAFSTKRVGAFADQYTMGNIGGRLVAPFRLVLDYQHSRIGYVPRARDADQTR